MLKIPQFKKSPATSVLNVKNIMKGVFAFKQKSMSNGFINYHSSVILFNNWDSWSPIKSVSSKRGEDLLLMDNIITSKRD